MNWLSILAIVGGFLTVFRMWLVGVKLSPFLKNESQFYSRYIALYCGIAAACCLSLKSFNFLLIAVLPQSIIAIFQSDIPFLMNLKKKKDPPQNLIPFIWLERLLLHIPHSILASAVLLPNYRTFLIPIGRVDIFLAIIVGFGTFLIFDPRHPFRKNPHDPITGKVIFYGNIVSFIGFILWIVTATL